MEKEPKSPREPIIIWATHSDSRRERAQQGVRVLVPPRPYRHLAWPVFSIWGVPIGVKCIFVAVLICLFLVTNDG